MVKKYSSAQDTSDNAIKNMKINIRRLMEEKNITQTQLSKQTGIDQPRISAALNENRSDCFTVEQLVRIALCLNASIDSIIELDHLSENQNTLACVYSRLFEIADATSIDFFAHNTDYGSRMGICFYNLGISDFLKEWSDINRIESLETKAKVFELWKRETLKEAHNGKAGLRQQLKELSKIQDVYDSYNPHKTAPRNAIDAAKSLGSSNTKPEEM